MRGSDERVGFAELFYDLVFVFAITRVSHVLLAHYDLKGAVQTGLLFLAIWWVWIYTTWVLNRLDPEKLSVRGLLFGLMVAGLFVSMALPEAFAERGLIFALAYCTMQIGRTLFVYLTAGKDDDLLRATYLRILIWFVASAVFWIAGGIVEPEHRLWFWVAALAIEYLGPVTGFAVPGLGRDVATNWEVRGGHLAERCGLFVIICLGETLLVSGATFSELHWDAAGLVAFLGAVAGTLGMWWVYFHIGHKRGTHQIEHSANPGALARLAFTYLHIPIVAGIVLAAVGSERAIAHPHAAGVLAESATVIGGVALFLLGNGLFKRISANNFPLSHWVGLVLCLGALLIGPWVPLMWLNALAALILVIVALWEQRSFARGPAAA